MDFLFISLETYLARDYVKLLNVPFAKITGIIKIDHRSEWKNTNVALIDIYISAGR